MELKTGFSVRGLQFTCIFLASEVKLFVGILMQKSDSVTVKPVFSVRGLQITCMFLASEVKLFVGILMQKSDSVTVK